MVAPLVHDRNGQQIDRGTQSGLTILCDFDGTIVQLDTAEYILDRFAAGDWRAIDQELDEGRISIEECMKRQFELISISRESIIEELDKIAVARTGFDRFVDSCRARSIDVVITSAGLDFYISHFLEMNGWSDYIHMIAPKVTETSEGISFAFPEKRFKLARNFKEDQVMRRQHLGATVAYLGDGVSDYWAALAADKAFAVRGSKLDRRLDFSGRFHHRFTDFHEVMAALELTPSLPGDEVHGA